MYRAVLLPIVFAALLPAPALASADKPILAPAPGWVVPHAFKIDKPDNADAPLSLLLDDQQIHFEAGRTTDYQEIAFRIQTPQGLSAGAINLRWDPDTDVLTVHKLVIRRGDQTIDVLAAGQQFTVLRREQNLESAVLNGQLTANLEPEGLQVGDIIDYAVTIAHQDPVLKGHYESIAGDFARVPVGTLALAAQWPAAAGVRWRAHGDLPAIKMAAHGGEDAVSWQMLGAQPLQAPKQAPPRFNSGRYVAFSDFKSWAEISALFTPLYAQAAKLSATSPLHAEVAKIVAASPDPKARAVAALKLVQDRVRYVFIGMGEGGLVPASADETWSRRFGDCKGKTALLLALLHELGIEAEPALANAGGNDGLDSELPTIGRFNHVLVRATIGGRVYWLDGTQAGDSDIDAIEPPGFGWVLPVQPAHAVLERIVQQPLNAPQLEKTLTLDASAGLSQPASAHAEEVFHGRAAVAIHAELGMVAGNILDQGLRSLWQKQYSNITVKSVSAAFDPATRTERLVMDGNEPMEWRAGRYETDETGVGYNADFTRASGPDVDAPFVVSFPEYVRVTENIRLPNHGRGFAISDDAKVERTLGGVEWRRSAQLADGVATIIASVRSIAPEFPAKDAPAVQQALHELARGTVYVVQTDMYHRTPQEVALLLAKPPVSTRDFVERGDALIDLGRYREAVAAFDKALAQEPQASRVLAERGLAHDALGENDLAAKDFAAARADTQSAAELNEICWRKATLAQASAAVLASAQADCDAALKQLPQAFAIMDSRALVLLRMGRNADALAQYSQAIALDPRLPSSLYGRALAEQRLGQAASYDKDAAAARALDPEIADTFVAFGVKNEAAAKAPAKAAAASAPVVAR